MIAADVADELGAAYRDWRDFCGAVQDAYDRWVHAPGWQAADAFREYRRLLDIEECLALECSVLVRSLG
jgi:hypothetical protein